MFPTHRNRRNNMNNVPKYYMSLVILTCSCTLCNLFLNTAWLLFSEGAGKSVMFWAFNRSHISPKPLFPIWWPIWSTTILCRKYYLLAKDWHTFAIIYTFFYYCILFPGVTPITIFPSARPSVGHKTSKATVIFCHYLILLVWITLMKY